MFENDDFDFDEDFLKDADDKAVTYYSQRDNFDEASDAKRRKLDEQKNDSTLSLDDSFDRDWTEPRNDKKKLSKVNLAKSKSRKDFVLDIFNTNSVTEKESRTECDKLQKTLKDLPAQTLASQQPSVRSQRGNLVLGILQKSQLQDGVNKNDQDENCVGQTFLSSQSAERKRKEQNYFGNSQCRSSSVNLSVQQPCTSHVEVVKNNSHVMYKSNERNCNENRPPYAASNKAEELRDNPRDNSRRQLLLESLKPSSSRCTENTAYIFQQPVVKIEKQPSEKVALVRKFPGPAGLLPDIMDGSVPPISYLKSLDENDNKQPNDHNETRLTEYCSQNTKNLFTEGAWQQMLDDLPDGFLNGHEISTIKQMASERCHHSTKIQFLAGILERVDHSHDNPFVILKDFTDSIQGIMHRDIPLEYPGLLEPNVVILLHNTGLLRVSGSLVMNNYRILISPSHLLGIYTGKGKIVRTSQMKKVLGHHLRSRFDEDTETRSELPVQYNLPSRSENRVSYNNALVDHENIMRNNVNGLNLSQSDEAQIVKTLSAYLEDRADETFEKCNVSSISDENADFSFSVSSRQITDLESEKNFTHTQTRSVDHVKNHESTNKESSASDSKEASNEQKMSEANLQNVTSERREDPGTPQKCISNMKPEKKSLRSKLLQFKSDDVLTPPDSNFPATSGINERDPSKEEESKKSGRRSSGEMDFASGVLNDSDDDTDDAVLSQLDMDSILNNYNQRAS